MNEIGKVKSAKIRYLVLAAGMVIQLCGGVIYMWAIFKNPVAAYLEQPAGEIALVSSVMLATFVFGMLLGGALQDRLGPKTVALIGSAMMSSSFLLTSQLGPETAGMIFFTYAILGGLGVGTVYSCTVACVNKWFPDRRGFATGAMVGSFGFSLVIFAPLTKYLLETKGVPETFMLLGISFLAICCTASLFLKNPPEGYFVTNKKVASEAKQYTPKEMVGTKSFYLITISMFFVLPAYFILNPQLVTLAEDRGLSDYAVVGVMLTGVFSATGRLTITWFSDRIGRMNTLVFVAITTLAGTLLLTFACGVMFLVCVAIISLAFGGASGSYAAVTAERFGTKNMGANYGLVSMGFGASALLFPFLSIKIVSAGDMAPAFFLAAATCVIALVLILILTRTKEETA